MKSFIVVIGLLAVAFGRTVTPRGRVFRPHQLSTNKIFGGYDTNITAVPWQVGVEERELTSRQRTQDIFRLICGGSIANERWVITAARCFERGSNPLNYLVRSGTSLLEYGGNTTEVAQIVLHPQWNTFNYHGDCALLRVITPFTFDATRQPIALATTEPAPEQIGLASGWGAIFVGGRPHEKLQGAPIPIRSRAHCDTIFGNIDETQICAGFPLGGVDMCVGDEGGPLVVSDFLVGIYSGGYSCAEPGFPKYYGNVANFSSWITSIIH